MKLSFYNTTTKYVVGYSLEIGDNDYWFTLGYQILVILIQYRVYIYVITSSARVLHMQTRTTNGFLSISIIFSIKLPTLCFNYFYLPVLNAKYVCKQLNYFYVNIFTTTNSNYCIKFIR